MTPKTIKESKECRVDRSSRDATPAVSIGEKRAPRVNWMTQATRMHIPDGIPEVVEAYLSPFHPLRMQFHATAIVPKFLAPISEAEQSRMTVASAGDIVKLRPGALIAVSERDGTNARWAVLVRYQPHDMGERFSAGMNICVEVAGTDRRTLNMHGTDLALYGESGAVQGCSRYGLDPEARFLLPDSPESSESLTREDMRLLPSRTRLIAEDPKPWTGGRFSKDVVLIRLVNDIVTFLPVQESCELRWHKTPPLVHEALRNLKPFVPHPFFTEQRAFITLPASTPPDTDKVAM